MDTIFVFKCRRCKRILKTVPGLKYHLKKYHGVCNGTEIDYEFIEVKTKSDGNNSSDNSAESADHHDVNDIPDEGSGVDSVEGKAVKNKTDNESDECGEVPDMRYAAGGDFNGGVVGGFIPQGTGAAPTGANIGHGGGIGRGGSTSLAVRGGGSRVCGPRGGLAARGGRGGLEGGGGRLRGGGGRIHSVVSWASGGTIKKNVLKVIKTGPKTLEIYFLSLL